MIILEHQDYIEVAEAYEMMNEGFFDNIWSKIKDMFKGIGGDVDKIIADENISKLIDMKTGEISPDILLNKIKKAKTKADMQAVYNSIRGIVKTGQYFLRSLKFQEDGMLTFMDQVAADKAGTAGAQKTAAEKPEGTTAQSTMMAGVSKEEIDKRVSDFDKTYKAAVATVTAEARQALDTLLKKSSAESTKNLINNRFSLAQTVLLLIEYDIKKLRLGMESLDALKQDMVKSYKTALDSGKKLQADVNSAKAGGGVTSEVYAKMDINAFLKEYPAEQVKKGASSKDFFIYPYVNDAYIAISGYDVNKKLVSYFYAEKEGKIGKAATAEPFDSFKSKLLTASKNIPPQKQKGGVTTAASTTAASTTAPAAPAPAATAATATAAPAMTTTTT